MKRLCKDIDITDIDFLKNAIEDCLKNKHKDRKDVSAFLEQYKTIENIAYLIQNEIKNKQLKLKPIYYRDKIDGSSGKIRRIGIQNIKHQIYDYVAVNGLQQLLRRIGDFQCASIKGRGQIYGMKYIRRWLRNEIQTKYVLKCDIEKFYPNINHQKIMSFLRRHVKNDVLLWLIEELLSTFGDSGLSIGSFLSQNLANLYLSDLYHFLLEDCYVMKNGRRGKPSTRQSLVNKVLFYMDDILVLGSNISHLRKVKKMMDVKLTEMGLMLKEKYELFQLTEDKFIDMMGFRIYRDHVTVRKRNWLRLRRAFVRFQKKLNNLTLARRVIAYWGFVRHTNSFKIRSKYNMDSLRYKAGKLISRSGISIFSEIDWAF